ncbi:rod shape-determining protein MreD [Sodalis sp. CWE]|uniref:rod shape-determining protein MreD n=1 Tax=Sodalis sp. CWE TaxID=2803816 RepID=UPI001C7CC4D9|nr:rod shape-determining protein MreD [Sodalis sp. CWE]MBX4180850.1 rod shape-determining protein MreD [Sodalis sp. CWE]
MNYQKNKLIIIILFSFLIAIILQVMPWPVQMCFFRPSWIKLLLIYWVMTMPYRINVGTGFTVGLIMDVILGSTIGVHALAFSTLAYLVVNQFRLFLNIRLWQQIFVVAWLSVATHLMIFLEEFLVINAVFHPKIFWSSVIDGALWPWFFLLMQKIKLKFFF